VRQGAPSRADFRTLTICCGGIAAAIVLIVLAIGIAEGHGARATVAGPMFQWLTWVGNTPLSVWISESESFLGYPTILFLHTLGLALVVGFSVSMDIRLLGIAQRIPIPALSRLFSFMWLGFWVNAISGLLLFIADPIRKATNPLFEIKLALVAIGVVLIIVIQKRLTQIEKDAEAERIPKTTSRLLAIASLSTWAAAITAGRLLAYIKGV
jgi:hypothetical protein